VTEQENKKSNQERLVNIGYFWDGGVHCITQDLYREGKMEDYIG